MSRHTAGANQWLAQAAGICHGGVRDLVQQAITAPSPADRLQQYRRRLRIDEASWDFVPRIAHGMRIIAAMQKRSKARTTAVAAPAGEQPKPNRRLRVVGGSRRG
jgi:hypothetical protein